MTQYKHSNNKKYLAWIKKVVGDCKWTKTKNGFWSMTGISEYNVKGEPLIQRCDVVAPAMVEDFPELKTIVGHYMSVHTKGYYMYHCWCTNRAGEIVDPTGRQFAPFEGPMDSYKDGTYLPTKELFPKLSIM